MIKIFIADDHIMFAEGVESLLVGEPDFLLCGKAGTAAETLRQVVADPPDVLLLDINLPDQSGLEVCRWLREELPQVKILVLSMFSDESYITAMLGLGAQGYVLKNTGKAELCNAIRALSGGKTYYSKEVTDTVMRSLVHNRTSSAAAKEPPKISRREREVLRLIIDELTTPEIAAQLFLSEKTVESHRAALLAKLGARNTAGLVKVALQWKLLDEGN
jgi:DNA-binding NarL/FixJ family response regulator